MDIEKLIEGMPKLVPLRILTKEQKYRVRFWRRVTYIRYWLTLEDWEYLLPDNGPRIIIPKDFKFDGASIPRIIWMILSPTGLLLTPGLIHDFGYRYNYIWAVDDEGYAYKHMLNVTQQDWDKLFKQVDEAVNDITGMNRLAYYGLVAFGFFAWRSHRKETYEELKPIRTIRED